MEISKFITDITNDAAEYAKSFKGALVKKDAYSDNGGKITRALVNSKLSVNKFKRISLGERPLIVVFHKTDCVTNICPVILNQT